MLTPQTISLIVANLERDGRLRRAVSPDHGRVQQMELTDEGQTLLAHCRERTSRLDTRLHHGLTLDQEQFLRSWLVDIATRDLLPGDD
jgi:DNA-binding MarR family transcriptional regulator